MLKRILNYRQFKSDFKENFNDLKTKDNLFNEFIEQVCNVSQLFIVGGYLRSIINNEKPKDIDFIFNASSGIISDILCNLSLSHSVNRLGGYKIHFKTVTVDIWSIDDNWAFKKKLVKRNDNYILERIADGCFYNYDSLVMDLRSLHCSIKNYNYCVSHSILDIVKKNLKYKKQSSKKEAIILRAFYLKKKYNLKFSAELKIYLEENIRYIHMTDGQITSRMTNTLNNYEKYLDSLSINDFDCFHLDSLFADVSTNNVHVSDPQQITIF